MARFSWHIIWYPHNYFYLSNLDVERLHWKLKIKSIIIPSCVMIKNLALKFDFFQFSIGLSPSLPWWDFQNTERDAWGGCRWYFSALGAASSLCYHSNQGMPDPIWFEMASFSMKMKKLQRSSRFPALWTWSGIAAALGSPTAAKVGWVVLRIVGFGVFLGLYFVFLGGLFFCEGWDWRNLRWYFTFKLRFLKKKLCYSFKSSEFCSVLPARYKMARSLYKVF